MSIIWQLVRYRFVIVIGSLGCWTCPGMMPDPGCIRFFCPWHDSLPFGTPGRFLWRICHRPGFRLLQLGPIWRYSYRFVEDNVPKTIKNNWTPPMEVYINVISHVVSQVVGILGKNGCGMVGMVGLLGFDFAAHQQTWNTHLRSRCVVPGAGYVSSLCPLKPDSAQVDRGQLNFLLATTHWNWTRHCAINLFVCLFCDVWSVFLGIRIFLICLMFLLSLLVF